MTIYYLMVKTHKITGLKYLCQTKRKNPYSYSGSGDYWKRHIQKHGRHIDTEIIRKCQSPEELKEWGLHYSELWNVVESKEWANLMPESGLGGNMTAKSLEKAIETKKKNGTLNSNTQESINKCKQTKLEKYGTLSPVKPGSILKGVETRKKNGTLNTNTQESINKCKQTKLEKYGTMSTHIRVCCIHCKKDITVASLSYSHGDKCKLKPE